MMLFVLYSAPFFFQVISGIKGTHTSRTDFKHYYFVKVLLNMQITATALCKSIHCQLLVGYQ